MNCGQTEKDLYLLNTVKIPGQSTVCLFHFLAACTHKTSSILPVTKVHSTWKFYSVLFTQVEVFCAKI